MNSAPSAFSEEDYWLARLAAFGGIGMLDSLIIGTDGSVTVVIIQDLRHELLPPPATTPRCGCGRRTRHRRCCAPS
jgi:hypothetical protein